MERFYSTTRKASHRGLTLIELVVVLTILVALGGLLVPMVGNALTQSHLATCTANFAEVTKMLYRAQAVNGTMGDGWTNPAAAAASDTTLAANIDFAGKLGTLSDEEIAALGELGMVNFSSIDTSVDDYNVTFNNGVGATAVLADDTDVVILGTDDTEGLYLPNDNGEKYVFFALDKTWSLLGTLCPEPPVHFGDTEGALPHQVYSRWGGIFKVGEGLDADYAALPVAEFQRVSVHIGGAFETSDNHSGVYWQEVH